MPLESASYIKDLDPANPAATDALAQADDHMRLIKSVVRNSFPNIGGAVTPSHTDLNGIPDLKTRLTALESGAMPRTGGIMTGGLDFAAGNVNVQAGKLMEKGAALIPRGCIIMWSGDINAVPAGWALCDGRTVDGIQTPNMVNRFVTGVGDAAMRELGGNNVLTITTNQSGAHGHNISVEGAHSHGGGTASHTLTVDQMPAHDHGVPSGSNIGRIGPGHAIPGVGTPLLDNQLFYGQGGNQGHAHGIGMDGAHGHGASIEGSHTHTFILNNRPAFVALAFIMKL